MTTLQTTIDQLQTQKQTLFAQLQERREELRQYAVGGCGYYRPHIALITKSGEDFSLERKFGNLVGKQAEREGVKILCTQNKSFIVLYNEQCVLSDSGNDIDSAYPALFYQPGAWEPILEAWRTELEANENQGKITELSAEIERLQAEIFALPKEENTTADVAFPVGTKAVYLVGRNGEREVTIEATIPHLKLYRVREIHGWISEEDFSPIIEKQSAPTQRQAIETDWQFDDEPDSYGEFRPNMTITLPDHRLTEILENGLTFHVIHHSREWIGEEGDYAHFYLVRITSPVPV